MALTTPPVGTALGNSTYPHRLYHSMLTEVRYVHPTEGNNSYDGLTWGTAKATLQAAYDALPAVGGTIKVTGDITLTTPLVVTKTIRIEGEQSSSSAEWPILINGSSAILSLGTSNVGGLEFTNLHFRAPNAVSIDGPAYITRTVFEKCTFESCATAVRLVPGSQAYSLVFRDCYFIENTGDIFHAQDGCALNNLMFDNCWWQGSSHVSYFRVDSDTGGEVSDILFTRNLFEGPANANLVATHRLGAVSRIVYNNCHWADFGVGSFVKPLFQTGANVNQHPIGWVMVGCEIFNFDGCLFDLPESFGQIEQLSLIGCELATLTPTQPFDLHTDQAVRASLVSCLISIAQTWNTVCDITYIACREAGVSIPFKVVNADYGAYTQTYSTADRTHANFTSADLATTATTQTTPYGFATQAQGDNIATQFNLLRADVADVKQVVNSLIDDLQALGLVT